ncbi:MAG: DUF302 domain-containing protein [Albidovulum sp.]
MKSSIAAAAAALLALPVLASPASAEIMRVQSTMAVPETMDALENAVTGAGATIFARVDHAGGAAGAGLELSASQLLIFGNPKLGTPAMQADPLAGLYLPLKVLVYEDADGAAWLAYDDPAAMFEGMNIPADAEYIKKMTGALAKLTGVAAGS